MCCAFVIPSPSIVFHDIYTQMPDNKSALLSVARVSALGVGILYGMINNLRVNSKAKKEREELHKHSEQGDEKHTEEKMKESMH